MAESLVEIVKRFQAHFNETREPLSDVFHPDVVWQAAREDPDAAEHRGVEAIDRYVAQWTETIHGIRVDSLEEIEAGDRVLSWVRITGRGAASGADIAMEQAQVWTFADGKAIRVEEYFDREEALAALGVRSD
jgi:ketosteroid isomerase-like protein